MSRIRFRVVSGALHRIAAALETEDITTDKTPQGKRESSILIHWRSAAVEFPLHFLTNNNLNANSRRRQSRNNAKGLEFPTATPDAQTVWITSPCPAYGNADIL